MTRKEILLEVLASIDLSSLPEEALSFLCDYLTSPDAISKVTNLLTEAQRLHSANAYQLGGYYEHVSYKESKR